MLFPACRPSSPDTVRHRFMYTPGRALWRIRGSTPAAPLKRSVVSSPLRELPGSLRPRADRTALQKITAAHCVLPGACCANERRPETLFLRMRSSASVKSGDRPDRVASTKDALRSVRKMCAVIPHHLGKGARSRAPVASPRPMARFMASSHHAPAKRSAVSSPHQGGLRAPRDPHGQASCR